MFKLEQSDTLKYAASVAGALLVLVVGKAIVAQRGKTAPAQHG